METVEIKISTLQREKEENSGNHRDAKYVCDMLNWIPNFTSTLGISRYLDKEWHLLNIVRNMWSGRTENKVVIVGWRYGCNDTI